MKDEKLLEVHKVLGIHDWILVESFEFDDRDYYEGVEAERGWAISTTGHDRRVCKICGLAQYSVPTLQWQQAGSPMEYRWVTYGNETAAVKLRLYVARVHEVFYQ